MMNNNKGDYMDSKLHWTFSFYRKCINIYLGFHYSEMLQEVQSDHVKYTVNLLIFKFYIFYHF